MVTVVITDSLEADGQPVKSRRKVTEKDQWLYLIENIGMGCVSQEKPHKSLFRGKLEVGINSSSQVLEDHDASRKNSGKKGSLTGNHTKM